MKEIRKFFVNLMHQNTENNYSFLCFSPERRRRGWFKI